MAKKGFVSLIPHPENTSASEPEVVIPSADVTVKENPVVTPLGTHLAEMSLKAGWPVGTTAEILREHRNADLSQYTKKAEAGVIHIPYGVFGESSPQGPQGHRGPIGPQGVHGVQGAQGYSSIKPEYVVGLQMAPESRDIDIVVMHLFKAYHKLKDMRKADPESEMLSRMTTSLKEYINSLYTYAMSTSDNATRQTLSQIMQSQMNKGYMSE